MKKLKIAIFSSMLSGAGGGAPRSAAVQAGALADSGADVTVFTGYSRKYPLTPEAFPLGRAKVVASKSWGPAALGLNVGSFLSFYRQCRSFDIVHVNMGWNLNTFIASRIARHFGVPYIYSLRSHMGEYHFRRFRFLKPVLFDLFEKRNIRDAFAVHVTADWESETSARAIGDQRIIKIPNAMDPSDFSDPVPREKARLELGLSSDAFHVVCLGRLGAQKNPEFLVRSFHEANLTEQTFLHFVGPPERRVKQKLLALIKDLELQGRVNFVDYVSGYKRRCWLSCADVFALPSHDENFCIALIEAVAAGTYGLITPHVGAIEYLPSGMLRVEPLELDRWSTAFRELALKPPPQTLCTKNLGELFSPRRIAQQWLDVYTSMGLPKHSQKVGECGDNGIHNQRNA